jgi:hypothetical protein
MARGSEWRKWDLHVHTSASFHWNGGKKLKSMSATEIEVDMQKLYDALNSSDCSVFCFMDYWSFDGYLAFKEFLEKKGLECPRTVFPGMELRIEAPVDYRLNIHVILSDKLTKQQLKDFQSKLTVLSMGRSISNECLCEFAKTLDVSKAKKQGFGDPCTLGEEDLLLLAAQTIEITKESLQDALKAIPRGCGFILMPYDTSDGLKKLDWETQPYADNYFMQSSDIFESRDEETRELFLNIETTKNKSFLLNFQKTIGGSPKPVICGSDAHKYSDYGKFPQNKATWIKADPTFEGLKQIVFEPSQRVKIQETIPEEKTPYLIIDKVRFLDKTSGKKFSSDWIEVNQNLNVIIGGKSSGKSLLLYHIAKSICPKLVDEMVAEAATNKYDLGSPDKFDFEILWNDSHLNSLNEDMKNKNRKITFIPQMYINHLAEKQGQKDLKQLIDSILEQDTEYKSFIGLIRENINQHMLNVIQAIKIFLNLQDQHLKLNSEKAAIGEKNAIKKEIKRLVDLTTILRKESDFTEEENKQYEKWVIKASSIEFRIKKYSLIAESINQQVSQLEGQLISIQKKNLSEYTADKLLNKYLDGISRFTRETIEEVYANIFAVVNSLLVKIEAKVVKLSKSKEIVNAALQPYKEKIKNQESLEKIQESLTQQNLKLSNIDKINKEILVITRKGTRAVEQVFENYRDIYKCYNEVTSELKKEEYTRIADNLELESFLTFDTIKFSETFVNLFDRRVNLRAVFGECFDDRNEFVFNIDKHLNYIENQIFPNLLTPGSVRLKSGVTQNDALDKLFGDYFNIEYNIKHKGDDILKMSPGKRGLVLLQLILHSSKATHPILIDQPEDNLDNRTIYYELKEFIKEKKIQRQIILVTHNANLVVATDAENVIVSNQSGQHIGKENREFKFEYISGSLENSFKNSTAKGILYQMGIREHVCDILEGGEEAFIKREQKYGLKV